MFHKSIFKFRGLPLTILKPMTTKSFPAYFATCYPSCRGLYPKTKALTRQFPKIVSSYIPTAATKKFISFSSTSSEGKNYLFVFFLASLFALGIMILSSWLTKKQTLEQFRSIKKQNKTAKSDCAKCTEYSLEPDSFFQKLLLGGYLHGSLSKSAIYPAEMYYSNLKELHMEHLLSAPLRLCIISLDNYRVISALQDKDECLALGKELGDTIFDVLSSLCPAPIAAESGQLVLLLKETDSDTISSTLEALQVSLKKQFNFTFTTVYSDVFHGISHLPRTQEKLNRLLDIRFYLGYGRILHPASFDSLPSKDFSLSQEFVGQLISSLHQGDKVASLATVQELLTIPVYYPVSQVHSQLSHFSYVVTHALLQHYPDQKEIINDLSHQLQIDLSTKETLSEIRDSFSTFISKFFNIQTGNYIIDDNDNTIVLAVDSIIQQNYSDPNLCLKQIALTLDLSSDYVGKLYRENRDISVYSQINNIRYEKVGALLRETNLSIDDILKKVGLKKTNYFYTMFKQYYGITLTEYRIKHAKEKYK